jgi:hypothetical protein
LPRNKTKIRVMTNQKKPITIKELRSKLRRGEVRFSFEKKDGSIREAVGTLKESLIPAEHLPKGEREPSPLVVNFYDLEKSSWRSMWIGTQVFE